MFIQTEATPNPATLKFLPGRIVLGSGTAEFRNPEEARSSPLAERLFGVSGVSGVFLGGDFVAVTKSEGEWPHLKPAILGAIMEHYMSGAPLMSDSAPVDALAESEDEFFAEEDAATKALMERTTMRGRVMVTGCTAHGRYLGRVCVLSFRTHRPQIDALVEDMTAAIGEIVS